MVGRARQAEGRELCFACMGAVGAERHPGQAGSRWMREAWASEAGVGVKGELGLAAERRGPQGQATGLGLSHPVGGPRPCVICDR